MGRGRNSLLVASAVVVALCLFGLIAAVAFSRGTQDVALLGARTQQLPVVRYTSSTATPTNTVITVQPPQLIATGLRNAAGAAWFHYLACGHTCERVSPPNNPSLPRDPLAHQAMSLHS